MSHLKPGFPNIKVSLPGVSREVRNGFNSVIRAVEKLRDLGINTLNLHDTQLEGLTDGSDADALHTHTFNNLVFTSSNITSIATRLFTSLQFTGSNLTSLATRLFTDLQFTGSNITSILTRNHNDLQNHQGGSASQRYHLTSTEHTDLTTGINADDQHIHDLNSGITLQLLRKTATYSVAVEDYGIGMDATGGARTFNLHTAVGNDGIVHILKKLDTTGSIVTVNPFGSETVDGETTYLLRTGGESITIIADDGEWAIISEYHRRMWGQWRNTAGVQNLSGTPVNLTLDLNDELSSSADFSEASDQITVKYSGRYRLSAVLVVEDQNTTGGPDAEILCEVQKNTALIAGGQIRFLHYETRRTTGTLECLDACNAGDIYRVRISQVQGSVNCRLRQSTGTFMIERIGN